MKVQSLYLYPVKSLAGVEVPGFELDDFGPKGDRRWMIVDDQNRFVTQRQMPRLALVSAVMSDDGVEVQIPDQGRFPLVPQEEQVRVVVWRDTADALMGDPAASAALSEFCGVPLRFVYMPDSSFRRVDPERVADNRRVGFADGFPFLLTNQASLDELNTRLTQPVSMTRFRPNIVIQGVPAWAEDNWRPLVIGTVGFQVVKPCSRCVLTTVDPETGIKDAGTEPLKTLSTYRKTPDGVIFGQNAIHLSSGRISVGDSVAISQQES
ncbi:MAG: MOSC domain-containing protein [Marinobacter vinifirmus]|jgi:hypothetical protein|tara:strand:- start:3585 stop:4382 length:798 start_codon:yes stop_codon:yes gene_type:complete